MKAKLRTTRLAPSFLLSPGTEQTIIVLGRNESIVNDGILVPQAAYEELQNEQWAKEDDIGKKTFASCLPPSA